MMKIIKLSAENIKRLIAVEIMPTGDLVQITGRNGQGKTSVLDAIWWALAGTDAIQAKPIRHGQENAKIQLELGSETIELLVERRFTAKDSYLTVRSADGRQYPSPQSLLDDLLGALTFDPLAFMRMKPADQFEQLRKLVGLDFGDLNAADQRDYDNRRDFNRDAKQAEVEAESIVVPAAVPDQQIDEDRIMAEVEAAHRAHAAAEQHHNSMTRERRSLEQWQHRLDETKRALEEAQAGLDACKGELVQLESRRAPEAPDPAKARARLDEARAANRAYEAAQRKRSVLRRGKELKAESDKLTAVMVARKKERQNRIADAQMPIDSLGLGEGHVMYRELPLNQASDAEQLLIATSIAAALNPKLRVIRIRDGSLLDTNSLTTLAQFAAERNFQIWIERVQDEGAVGVVIEDGQIKGTEAAAPLEAG